MTILTVGAGQQFAKLSAAIAAAQSGDTIQVQAGTYTNDSAYIGKKLTIQGVGGMATLVSTQNIANGKAILVINADVTLDHIAFKGATVRDNNGAGIRYEGGNLVVTNSLFTNNQNGILAANSPTGTITIENSEFGYNGRGDGLTHNLYVNNVAQLTIRNSYFHDAVVGHEIKSRAQNTLIENSRIFDNSGTASYSIDLPQAGNAVIRNNVIEQGPNSQNPYILAYGEEGAAYGFREGRSLTITGNTIVNHLTTRPPGGLLNPAKIPVTMTNNTLHGITQTQFSGGQTGTISGNTIAATHPALDTTSRPWAAATPQPVPVPPVVVTPDPVVVVPAPTPGPITLGVGADTVTLGISGDAYRGNAQFVVMLDGVQLGGVQTATASRAAGQSQVVQIRGDFTHGARQIGVKFLNDAWGGTSSTDRNLYVTSIGLNGTDTRQSAALTLSGLKTFSVGSRSSTSTPAPVVSTPAPVPAPTPAADDTLVVRISADAASKMQFVASIDGKALGAPTTITRLTDGSGGQAYTYTGSFGSGPHIASISVSNASGVPAGERHFATITSLSFDARDMLAAPVQLRTGQTELVAVNTNAPLSMLLPTTKAASMIPMLREMAA